MKKLLIARPIALCFTLSLLFLVLCPQQAAAGAFELSLGFSFNRSNYTGSNYSWSRHWGATAGYYFTEHSEIEFSVQDIVDRTSIMGYEDTTFHDQIYSFNWVQSLTSKDFPVQPYVKVGLGQLNREATGSYANGGSPPAIVDSLTVVLGAGLRLYFTKKFAIRSEATTYLTGGNIQTWKNNVSTNIGVSFYF